MIHLKPLGLAAIAIAIVCRTAPAEILYELDFSKAEGDVKTWFERQGWAFHGDILEMNPRFENETLVLETTDDDSGAFLYQFGPDCAIQPASYICIEWGVEQYPEGAEWEGPYHKKRNTRDPINVIVSFGTKKISSGMLLVPPTPYFIGLFPADGAETGKAYLGNYWQEGGRYFCISGDGSKDPFTTQFALSDKFKEAFGHPAPPITGLSIAVDAKNTAKVNGRHSKAHIRKITIMAAPSAGETI